MEKDKVSQITKTLFYARLLDMVGRSIVECELNEEDLNKLFFKVRKTYFPDEKFKKSPDAPAGDMPAE